MNLLFEAAGERWTISCDTARAPHTLAALSRILPLPFQLHTPKIAGHHIYWHAPFIENVEAGMDVLNTPPGAFIYWPVRQFLEITFAPLQAETATVTVLGQLDGPVDGIRKLAERLRETQGTQLFSGRLAHAEPAGIIEPLHGPTSVPQHLVSARLALWAACPQDIASLNASRAIMHPAGPGFMADGEARGLHETLWWVRQRLGREDAAKLAFAAGLALNRTALRLRDFCHFTTSSQLLFDFEAAIKDMPDLFAELLDEAILSSGRISAWIDLQIPWNGANQGYREALDKVQATAGVHALA